MFKKLVLTALVVAAGIFILNHTRLGSYGHTAFGRIKKAAQCEVPVEFEVERIRREIAQLTPDMKKHFSAMAEEMVSIENLKDEIQVARTNLEKKKKELYVAREAIKSGLERVSYDGRVYNQGKLAERLARDLAACQRLEKDLEIREQVLEQKEKGLEVAKEQLQAMRDQKAELELQVQQIESEIKAVRLSQTRSKFAVDDSRLSDIKRSIRDLRNRLQKDRIALELEGQFTPDHNAAPVRKETAKVKDVIQELDAYLDGDKPEMSKVAVKPATK